MSIDEAISMESVKEKLRELKDQLCSEYFPEIDSREIIIDAEVTNTSSENLVYSGIYRDSFGPGYVLCVGLPEEVLANESLFREIFMGGLAHELGHVVRGHPGSLRKGLAYVSNILGLRFKPLKRIGEKMSQNIESEADQEVKNRGLEYALDSAIKKGRKINGLD